MQEHAADQLGIKRPQTQRTFGGLTTVCKCLRQDRIQAFAASDTFLERCSLGDDIRIGQRRELRL